MWLCGSKNTWNKWASLAFGGWAQGPPQYRTYRKAKRVHCQFQKHSYHAFSNKSLSFCSIAVTPSIIGFSVIVVVYFIRTPFWQRQPVSEDCGAHQEGLRDPGVLTVESETAWLRESRQRSLPLVLRLCMRRMDGQESTASEEDGPFRHESDEGRSRRKTQGWVTVLCTLCEKTLMPC